MTRRRTFLRAGTAVVSGVVAGSLRSGTATAAPGTVDGAGAGAPAGALPQPTVTLTPVPDTVAGVREPVLSLNGSWSIATEPPAEFWRDDVDTSGWPRIEVPAEPAMQGVDVEPPGLRLRRR
ncbi:hypothetical protein ACIQKB_01665 [Streptomyces sp. NPDC092046]|uniref:hypothetical protein n=1 Tax=Streptomyces sp. NPDC092046 TaxID=3366009 RepID=UPI003827E417